MNPDDQETTDIELNNQDADTDAAIKGDAAAFGRLFDANGDRVYRHIYYRVGNVQDAQDLTQQAFTNAFKAIGRFKKTEIPFIGWIMRISHNLVVDHYRSRKQIVDLDSEPDLEDTGASPGAIAEKHALQTLLRRYILQLPKDQQMVITMRFIEDLDYAVIAKMLGKPEGTVRVLQHRGLAMLRRLMGPEEALRWKI